MVPWHLRRIRERGSAIQRKREKFLAHEKNPKHPKDIFCQAVRFPTHVFIVAPGFGGLPGYPLIKPEHYVIAVNRGIRTPIDHADLWMAADRNAPNADWFPEPVPFPNCKNLFDDGWLRKLSDKGELAQKYDYVFRTGWRIEFDDARLRYGILRGGCTVSCQAMQLAFWLGAKHITLIGVAMNTPLYWDNKNSNAYGDRQGKWPITGKVNKVIEFINQHGCLVDSWTYTALKVPVVEPETRIG